MIGGGPTGLKLAGDIAEAGEDGAGPLLPQHRTARSPDRADRLGRALARGLSGRPVGPCQAPRRSSEVRLDKRVTDWSAMGVVIDGLEGIESECVIWAAGEAATPTAKWLSAEKDRAGRRSIRTSLCGTIPRSSASAIRSLSRVRTASPCAAWHRPPSSKAPSPPPRCAAGEGQRDRAALPLPQFRHAGDLCRRDDAVRGDLEDQYPSGIKFIMTSHWRIEPFGRILYSY